MPEVGVLPPPEREPFQVGDLLLFAGGELESRLIAMATTPPCFWCWPNWRLVSHIGICFARHGAIELIESTTLTDLPCRVTGRPIKGVQVHLPQERLANYYGRVYCMRPQWRYRPESHTSGELTRFLTSFVGTPYDMLGAIRCGTRWIHGADWRRVFCSKVVRAALEQIHLAAVSNANSWSPSSLARNLHWTGRFQTPELVHVG